MDQLKKQIEDLEQELDGQDKFVEKVALLAVGQKKLVDDIQRDRRFVLIVGAIFLLFAAGVSIFAWLEHDNRRELQESNERIEQLFNELRDSREQSLQTTCEDSNRDRVAFNATLLDVFASRPQEPEDIPRIQEFLRNRLRPIRICTKDAIELFYESGGREGVLPTVVPDIPVEQEEIP